MAHHQLDARRLLCPLPVIRAQQRIETLATGDTLDVICTDPGAKLDIPAWCRVHGHKIVAVSEQQREITITVEVGPRG